ncbi:MAG: hypothetical protein COV01_03890 [Candidatus Taylorbacteria bacterium CG10_big_fil_rev_8_21_14_0_10_41_48]|uniref:Restriction endonuclease type IV Mrr domain-containing protein n=1 Tax=Candidatus Taylorbacteria bacterium CG10_big_fil_rev_8_21_14_0_10_41_48 TaxID=1975024 RepID=A0A2M8LB60_9BACT|nr:MAG: hypothetical protein COV01_03890 [Candidatus Taylorbacteria bacterium CG10_big_fil_rev_8_21_14_0_10_41_48]
MTSREFVGAELEHAYAEVFGGKVNGWFNDHGHDIILEDDEIPSVQVKSSVPFAFKFLKESLRRHRFIPICVGEPGDKEEMLTSLKQFGGFVGHNIPGRQEILRGIERVRNICCT